MRRRRSCDARGNCEHGSHGSDRTGRGFEPVARRNRFRREKSSRGRERAKAGAISGQREARETRRGHPSIAPRRMPARSATGGSRFMLRLPLHGAAAAQHSPERSRWRGADLGCGAHSSGPTGPLFQGIGPRAKAGSVAPDAGGRSGRRRARPTAACHRLSAVAMALGKVPQCGLRPIATTPFRRPNRCSSDAQSGHPAMIALAVVAAQCPLAPALAGCARWAAKRDPSHRWGRRKRGA